MNDVFNLYLEWFGDEIEKMLWMAHGGGMHREEIVLDSPHGKVPLDIRYLAEERLPTVLFIHGFVGFKDWGALNLVADAFAKGGYLFAKCNLSHNGTTPENPTEFVDLEAFASDNYSIQLDDIGAVIDYLARHPHVDMNRLTLLGHSRAGGLVLLKAAEDERVDHVVAWSPVSDMGGWPDHKLSLWQSEGRIYYTNARTKQELPIDWQLVEDYYGNAERLDLKLVTPRIKQPVLLVHAKDDTVVPASSCTLLKELMPHARVHLVETGGHTFGDKHPWTDTYLPGPLKEAVEQTLAFLS